MTMVMVNRLWRMTTKSQLVSASMQGSMATINEEQEDEDDNLNYNDDNFIQGMRLGEGRDGDDDEEEDDDDDDDDDDNGNDDNVIDGMRLWAGRDGLIGRSLEAAVRWITTL